MTVDSSATIGLLDDIAPSTSSDSWMSSVLIIRLERKKVFLVCIWSVVEFNSSAHANLQSGRGQAKRAPLQTFLAIILWKQILSGGALRFAPFPTANHQSFGISIKPYFLESGLIQIKHRPTAFAWRPLDLCIYQACPRPHVG